MIVPMWFVGLLLAVIWGVVYALTLWRTPAGRFLRLRRTWLAVTVGVGVDLLICRLVVDTATWLAVTGIIAGSAVAIIGFSLIGEYRNHQAELAEAREERR